MFNHVNLSASTAPTLAQLKAAVAKIANPDERINYLSQVAASEFKCVDKCDKWAMDWLERYESELN